MKALARIEANPRTSLDQNEETFGRIAVMARFRGRLSLILHCERFDPMVFGASNSICAVERKRLTDLRLNELQELMAAAAKRD
jgi:hypothetical protein